MIETLLLTVTRTSTKRQGTVLSNATAFFFERSDGLFLVTNRHVFLDETADHRPDAIDIELHVNAENIAETVTVTLPLYAGEEPLWRETTDSSGVVDVVTLPIDRLALPESLVYKPFTPEHLVEQLDEVEVGTPLTVVGFPLGFYDQLHRLAVARQAIIASAFGLRFQGTGCFLTDGRTHRGSSGGPVVARTSNRRGRSVLPFALLGVHGSRIDMVSRNLEQDEALGLNCAWYADVLLPLTEPSENAGWLHGRR